MRGKMAAVLGALTEEQALAVWLALGQWADNTRMSVEEDPSVEEFIDGGAETLEKVEEVVTDLTQALVSTLS